MALFDKLTDWFSSTPTPETVSKTMKQSLQRIGTAMRYSSIALVLVTATTDMVQAQGRSSDATTPVIEAIDQSEVTSLYSDAQEINANMSFEPEDLPVQTTYAKQVKARFESVADEIQQLIDDGEIAEANRLLNVLDVSIQNVHYNLSRLLESTKQADGDKDLIQTLEQLTKDLLAVHDSIDAQRNLLENAASNAVDILKQRVANDPNATYQENDNELTVRITAEAKELSLARSKAVSSLQSHMRKTDLNGETRFAVDRSDDGSITATTITTIQL